MTEEHHTPEETSAEAIEKAKEAATAVERAREEQLHHANRASEERIKSSITKAIEDAFKRDTNTGEQRFIDTARIPLICRDIAQMKQNIGAINENLRWGIRVVIGAVILGLVAMLIK